MQLFIFLLFVRIFIFAMKTIGHQNFIWFEIFVPCDEVYFFCKNVYLDWCMIVSINNKPDIDTRTTSMVAKKWLYMPLYAPQWLWWWGLKTLVCKDLSCILFVEQHLLIICYYIMYLVNFELLKFLELTNYHLEIGNLEKKTLI